MFLNEKSTIDDDVEIMKCRNDKTHTPVKWDGPWDPMYSEEGTRLVQWTCKQCGGSFAKQVPEQDVQRLSDKYKE